MTLEGLLSKLDKISVFSSESPSGDNWRLSFFSRLLARSSRSNDSSLFPLFSSDFDLDSDSSVGELLSQSRSPSSLSPAGLSHSSTRSSSWKSSLEDSPSFWSWKSYPESSALDLLRRYSMSNSDSPSSLSLELPPIRPSRSSILSIILIRRTLELLLGELGSLAKGAFRAVSNAAGPTLISMASLGLWTI